MHASSFQQLLLVYLHHAHGWYTTTGTRPQGAVGYIIVVIAHDSQTLPHSLTASTTAIKPMTLGRFVLLHRLGQGGMGVVYAAYDPQLDRQVALKLLRPSQRSDSGQQQARMLREAQALARLAHAHVVPIYDVGVIDEQVFLVMAYIPGQDLDQWVASDNRSWEQIVDVYCQAGRGLAAAHAAGIIHRDFKPANARISPDGLVKVLDFGLARGHGHNPAESNTEPTSRVSQQERFDTHTSSPEQVISPYDATIIPNESPESAADLSGDFRPPNSSGEPGTRLSPHSSGNLNHALTEVGALVGTPAYMPPEQYAGSHIGPAADQFSLCVAMYTALYGQHPFSGKTLAEVQAEIRIGRVRQPATTESRNKHAVNDQNQSDMQPMPPWVFQALRRGLNAEPDERYPSMEELVRAFRSDTARDLRSTRRAGIMFMSAAGVMSTIVALGMFLDSPNLYAKPLTLAMCMLPAGMMVLSVLTLIVFRRSLLANRTTQKLLSLVLMTMGLMTVMRFTGWHLGVMVSAAIVSEMFMMASTMAISALLFLPRFWYGTAIGLLTALGVTLWPEHTVAFMYFGYSGVTISVIWVWVTSAENRIPTN